MTVFEIRRCDYCGADSNPHPERPEQLEKAGWRRDEDGRDVCVTCVFCEDTGPIEDAA